MYSKSFRFLAARALGANTYINCNWPQSNVRRGTYVFVSRSKIGLRVWFESSQSLSKCREKGMELARADAGAGGEPEQAEESLYNATRWWKCRTVGGHLLRLRQQNDSIQYYFRFKHKK